MKNGESITDMRKMMKIGSPIPSDLWKALNHVTNYAEHSITTDTDYKHLEGLKESIELVSEYASCFNAKGEVSQRGEKPSAWKQNTIFDDYNKVSKYNFTDEASAEQKDANAKKLLEELT